MTSKILSFFLFVVVVVIVTMNSAESHPPADDLTMQFIHTSCNTTLYPSLCFSSLAPYAYIVLDHSPVRLAHLAVNITRAYARSLYRHVAVLRKSPLLPRESKALQDCSETLDDAIGLAFNSAAQLYQVENATAGPNVAWWVSNVQTWMSAVIANEETCCDGFGKVTGSTVKADVCGRVSRAEQYCSNALALVNKL